MNDDLRAKAEEERQAYSVAGDPDTISNLNNTCRNLIEIAHVCHLDNALEVIQEGIINPRRVLNPDRFLSKTDIEVVWLSPRDWDEPIFGGYQYGNVAFEFDWERMSKGLTPYWAEVATEYTIHAPVILLTDVDRHDEFLEYDPTRRDGPWWHDVCNNSHYWNGRHTLEIALERPVLLSECKYIHFVNHHKQYCILCKQDPTWTCNDKGMKLDKAAVAFIADVLITRVPLSSISHTFVENGGCRLSHLVSHAWGYLSDELQGLDPRFDGSIDADARTASDRASSVIRSIADGDADTAAELASGFSSANHLLLTAKQLIADAFGVPVHKMKSR